MTKEHTIEMLIAALPADGTALSNKRLQEALGWSKSDFEQVRELALAARLVKKAPGKGGSTRRVLDAQAEASAPDDESESERDESEAMSETPSTESSPAPQASNPKEEFALQLHADVEARRLSGRRSYEQSLIEYAIEALGEDQFDDPVAFSYLDEDSFSGEVRLRVDGYDPHDDDDDDRALIDLFIVHAAAPFKAGPDGSLVVAIPTFDGAQVNGLFRAARRFVEESRRELHRELTNDPEARDLARSIKASRNLNRVNINLVTNTEVRQFDRTPETVDGVEVVKRVLDINYLRRLFTPDDIEVDFSAAQTGGIPCVPLPDKNGVYRSFLAIVPGEFLYRLYDKYKQRLLEANVRSYLRASGKSVNQRIIDTIRKSPEMFFAYNNGITATADELLVEAAPDGGWTLVRCRNLQIVNGGQTTASLFQAIQRKIPLDRVFVPMKINEVLDHSQAASVVQQISLYANSQNKVNLSDFGANQAFHVKLQKLAQQEVPPAPAVDVTKGAQWFYERMRGEYKTALGLERTPARKRDYQLRYPKQQVITKTDVARYTMTWDQKPFSVCFGAEKNYLKYRAQLPADFEPDAAWFHGLIAKAILTEHCDGLVVRSKIAGYKANIVAYTIALLSLERGAAIDLGAIWRAQRVDDETTAWLVETIEFVRAHITRPPREGMNVGEWTKKEECWKQLVTQRSARTT